MPRYKALAKGFYKGTMYSPTGKRKIVHTDVKLDKVPSWLRLMPEESAAAKKKREAAEAKANKANVEKVKSDKADVDSASFLGTPDDVVETV